MTRRWRRRGPAPFYVWELRALRHNDQFMLDRYNGFVVVAQTEARARVYVCENCDGGDECRIIAKDYWANAAHSTCVKVGVSILNAERLVLKDFAQG